MSVQTRTDNIAISILAGITGGAMFALAAIDPPLPPEPDAWRLPLLCVIALISAAAAVLISGVAYCLLQGYIEQN